MPVDYAGNRFATAREFDISANPQTFTDYVGPLDRKDIYSFTLNSSSSCSLALEGLSANANVQLINSNYQVVETSNNYGTSAESINADLEAGTYYIKVYPGNTNASTYYDLTVSATTQSTDLYYFTYYYGNGDFYNGYGYSNSDTYYSGQYVGYADGSYNETGYDGYYYISSVYSGYSGTSGSVNVYSYYDSDTGYGYAYSASGSSSFGLTSEYGYAYNSGYSNTESFFGYNYYEADLA